MAKNKKGKELGKGLYQRKDGSYSARFVTRSGKRIERYFKTLAEAKNWLLKAKAEDTISTLDVPTTDKESKSPLVSFSAKTTVEEWFQFCMDTLWADLANNTRRNRRERYDKNIKNHIGNLSLKDVKPMHCTQILNDMEEKPYDCFGNHYAGSTIRQTYIVLGIMFKEAISNDLIAKHPLDDVKFKKTVKSVDDIHFLTVEEQKKFLAVAADSNNGRQYQLLLETGLRTGELIGLTFDDIDFENRTLSVNRSLEFRYKSGKWQAGPPKTKTSYRTIHLTQTAFEILSQLQEERPYRKEAPELDQILPYEDKRTDKIKYLNMRDLVFINFRTGMPAKNSSYDTHLYKLCDKAGIDHFCMHALRHTFATRCIEYGIRPKVLQQILGHASLKVTMDTYVHNTDDSMADAVNIFELGSKKNGIKNAKNGVKMA